MADLLHFGLNVENPIVISIKTKFQRALQLCYTPFMSKKIPWKYRSILTVEHFPNRGMQGS